LQNLAIVNVKLDVIYFLYGNCNGSLIFAFTVLVAVNCATW